MHLFLQIHNLQLLIFNMDGLEFLAILDYVLLCLFCNIIKLNIFVFFYYIITFNFFFLTYLIFARCSWSLLNFFSKNIIPFSLINLCCVFNILVYYFLRSLFDLLKDYLRQFSFFLNSLFFFLSELLLNSFL